MKEICLFVLEKNFLIVSSGVMQFAEFLLPRISRVTQLFSDCNVFYMMKYDA